MIGFIDEDPTSTNVTLINSSQPTTTKTVYNTLSTYTPTSSPEDLPTPKREVNKCKRRHHWIRWGKAGKKCADCGKINY